MNTNQLKRFAQSARIKLIDQIGAKLEKVLTTDSVELREKAGHLKKLQEAINKTSKSEVIDTVAYTWFNRFVALRFMDVNGYEPIGVSVVSPMEGGTLPAILQEAKQGNIPEELAVQNQRIYDVLDGKIPSTDAQNEAYAALLVGACNHFSKTLPFLFEKIDDYAELLLPDDLISQFSILQDVRDGMTAEDCTEVEIIGWLYQFYISEKKDQVFASKGKVRKEDIPAATQLFTPRWIVEYMVQNTLGKLWLQNNPQSKLGDHMPYFIESPSVTADDYLKIDSVEDITLLDQACGSGHILVYGFELLSKIYEEQGYNESEIPKLIIEKNLHGFEIDTRAAQLAALALMLKARQYYRRVFKKDCAPNILFYKELQLTVYRHNDSTAVFTVKNKSKLLNDIAVYDYIIAEDIIDEWQEDFTDEDTGETITIDRTKVMLKKGSSIKDTDLKNIHTFGDTEVAFFVDEIKDSFRLAKLELGYFIYLDLLNIQQATNLGSLIIPKTPISDIEETLINIKKSITTADLFLKNNLEKIAQALGQLIPLSRKYHCVVDNPPYMGGGNMNKPLADFVKLNYPKSKADLMACFMEAGLAALEPKGFLGMINQHSWMFLSSYEKLREHLIDTTHFDTMLHLGPRTFPEIGGEVVQNTAFTFCNNVSISPGSYLRLVDFNKSKEQSLEAIQGDDCEYFFKSTQNSFRKIPGFPIAYWVGEKFLNAFEQANFVIDNIDVKQGLATGRNDEFLSLWYEVSLNKVGFNFKNNDQALKSNFVWYPYNKGGGYKKWYGNQFYVIRFNKEAFDKLSNQGNNLPSRKYYFKESITWSDVSTGSFASRYSPQGFVFDVKGSSGFSDNIYYDIGLLNCIFSTSALFVLNPTMSYQVGNIKSIPYKFDEEREKKIIELTTHSISITKEHWDSIDSNWDFQTNELIRINGQDLEEAYNSYRQYWQNKFFELHKNEEELNKQFIDIYGLQDELTPDVPLKDITILKEETIIKKGALVFRESEIMVQFINYAVGCMFGRYSLDKPGLILANQGETLETYLENLKASNSKFETLEDLTFVPDDDNVIPVLDNEWFEDDIVNRFYAFLKATFGKPNFDKNLAFLEDAVGDIRKYFLKTFYTDHVKRYKKRPIYWLFSSPSGAFNALIYMHRYTPDTLNTMLNGYLKEYQEKLKAQDTQLAHVKNIGTDREKINAEKKQARISKVLIELQEYDRELFKIATERISIDLDDGVLVNYNKFGHVIKQVSGLNDKKAKDKVKKFDWIDVTEIQ
jgi:type II restriction/modification system DNA methylase subunit YeeA